MVGTGSAFGVVFIITVELFVVVLCAVVVVVVVVVVAVAVVVVVVVVVDVVVVNTVVDGMISLMFEISFILLTVVPSGLVGLYENRGVLS